MKLYSNCTLLKGNRYPFFLFFFKKILLNLKSRSVYYIHIKILARKANKKAK